MSEKQYRMIAIDLDGTLLSPLGRVTERTKAAVHRALEAGLLVCFATGRNFTESQTVLDDVNHFASAVFVGGAMVIDTSKRITLHRQLMEPALAAEVCAELESAGHAALALQDTATAGVDYLVSDGVDLHADTTRWLKMTRSRWQRVNNLGQYRHEHTVRVGICATPEEAALAWRMLEQKFGERIFCHSIRVPQTNAEVIEIFDPSVNKWQGLLHVARRHEIDPSQIIAIGDDVNDLHMIRNAGLGVAMGNAKPEVKAIAKKIIGTNQDDGLAVFLEELIDSRAIEPLN